MYRLFQDPVTDLIEQLRFEALQLLERFHEDVSIEILDDRLSSFMELYDELKELIDEDLLKNSSLSKHVHFLNYYLRRDKRESCEADMNSIVEKDLDTLETIYVGKFEGVIYDRNLNVSIRNLLEQSELDSAVRKSFVILSGKLREKYNISKGIDGEALVNKVYGQKGESKLEGNERDSLRNLLNGMYGLFRNDYMHNDNDGEEAMSIIHMINTILLKIDKLDDV